MVEQHNIAKIMIESDRACVRGLVQSAPAQLKLKLRSSLAVKQASKSLRRQTREVHLRVHLTRLLLVHHPSRARDTEACKNSRPHDGRKAKDP
jgi:hypothetical protein